MKDIHVADKHHPTCKQVTDAINTDISKPRAFFHGRTELPKRTFSGGTATPSIMWHTLNSVFSL